MSETAQLRARDAADGFIEHDHGKQSLRVWLRLLRATTQIEHEVRRRLREAYDMTLPRFDMMAAVSRNPEGVTMGDLSRHMMVTGGNVTGLVDRLEAEGLLERRPHATDRRSYVIALTPAGRRAFAEMAATHEGWVENILGDLSDSEMERLIGLLNKVRASARRAAEDARMEKGENA